MLDPAGVLEDVEIVEFILFTEDFRRGLCCPATALGQATSCHCCFIIEKDLRLLFIKNYS